MSSRAVDGTLPPTQATIYARGDETSRFAMARTPDGLGLRIAPCDRPEQVTTFRVGIGIASQFYFCKTFYAQAGVWAMT